MTKVPKANSDISNILDQAFPPEWAEMIEAVNEAYLALQTVATCLRNQHILLLVDSQFAIAYVNHKGGAWSKQLSDLALEVWGWCLQKDLTIHAARLTEHDSRQGVLERGRF